MTHGGNSEIKEMIFGSNFEIHILTYDSDSVIWQ